MAINIRGIQESPYGDAVRQHGSMRAAARALDIPFTTFRRRLKKEEQGVPDGHSLAGVSTLYDSNGNVKQQWVKTLQSKEAIEEKINAFIEGIKCDIPRATPVMPPKETDSQLLSCYVVTDYHMGQLSWGEETGEDWDVEIARDLLISWFARAIQAAPNARVGVLAQLGDFLHWDGWDAVTPTSGHLLDADTRFFKLAFEAAKVLKAVTEMMLEKHDEVHVIMAEGNHDMASSAWLKVIWSLVYENEPRISVDQNPSPYYCKEWGDTCLFFHHGHKKKIKGISKTFAGIYKKEFGKSKYVYAHMGHLHHAEVKEDELMVVEQHQTLAAKDAHSARGGYMSQRGASVITYSKTAGEVSRTTIRPEFR